MQNQCSFFFPKIVVLVTLMFISLFLFQFGCFAFSVEAFKQFTPKVCILVQQYLVCGIAQKGGVFFVLNMNCIHAKLNNSSICSESAVCPKHELYSYQTKSQLNMYYVVRVLHFSASSLISVTV